MCVSGGGGQNYKPSVVGGVDFKIKIWRGGGSTKK